MSIKSVFLLVIVIYVVSCQIDGEFWWLNNDITKLKHGTAPPPIFDDINELDTDETAKVIFKDSEGKKEKSLKVDKDTLSVIHFRDGTELGKQPFEFNKLNVNNKLWEEPLKQIDIKNNNSTQNTEDEFRFVFPSDNNIIWTETKHDINIKNPLETENIEEYSNKIRVTTDILPQNVVKSNDMNRLLPENICTFIKKSECIHKKGTLYEPWIKVNINMTIPNTQVVCCILPITTTSVPKIIFPDKYWDIKRHKRSNAENENLALKQRNTLINRKYAPQIQKVKVTTPSTHKRVNQKITNSDEYPIDPYWNIKNSNIRNPDIPTYQDPDAESDYGSHSYGDDYTVELPKPGLNGLYSDHRQTQSKWTDNKNKGFYYDSSDSVEEVFETSLGYSTIDPRRDHLQTSRPIMPFRQRPLKHTATPSRVSKPSLQDPTITFHSNPDFQVLQGFKLLNIVQNKNRFTRKTAETNKQCSDTELKCGQTQRDQSGCESALENGIVQFGGHPWMALVTLTTSERSILCYATLVHSRVAVSIADCVNGKSPGAVSIIAGVHNLVEDLYQSQRRMATITLDPKYTPGNMNNNLALLHWLRPLIFNARVQPACLGDPHKDDRCVFVGWGGYDQEMHSDLRWQRASILDRQNCNKRLSKLEVSDAFCAAVESRGTVTGIGGPLLCKSNERWSAVGVAVWRNDVVILLPQREWVIRNMISLRLQ